MLNIKSLTAVTAINLAWDAYLFAISLIGFSALTIGVKGWAAFHSASPRTHSEVRLNITYNLLDAIFVTAAVSSAAAMIHRLLGGWSLFAPSAWNVSAMLTLVLILFAGDLVGYWRHRLEHSTALWPTHAIHHSDTELTWTSLDRFHPINRLTSVVIDTTALSLVGFPAWAISTSMMVRHFYGQFEHTDLPWSFGPLSRVFVSPRAHRWHHAPIQDVPIRECNFAVLFSFIDVVFGTFYCPNRKPETGIDEAISANWFGQFVHPFSAWTRMLLKRLRSGDPLAIAHE